MPSVFCCFDAAVLILFFKILCDLFYLNFDSFFFYFCQRCLSFCDGAARTVYAFCLVTTLGYRTLSRDCFDMICLHHWYHMYQVVVPYKLLSFLLFHLVVFLFSLVPLTCVFPIFASSSGTFLLNGKKLLF